MTATHRQRRKYRLEGTALRSSHKKREPFLTAIVLLSLSSSLAPAPLLAQSSVSAWMRWEHPLTSTKNSGSPTYSNPYKNLRLSVAWTCLTNCATAQAYWISRLPVYGFWDGGLTFKLRATFPQPLNGAATATWRWTTTCSTPIPGSDLDCSQGDSGLNTTGTVTVTPSDAAHGITNPLYIGGLFGLGEGSVAEDGQLVRGNSYLSNDNGPYYWQGDTAWAAALRSTFNAAGVSNPCTSSDWSTNDWKCYVQDRAGKSFSAVHISVPQNWMKNPYRDSNDQAPFVNNATFPAWAKWNPAYWQGFEQKIEHANQQGLVVFVVGLMEPSYQYLAGTITDAQRYPPLADAQTFARNLAARLAGNFVVFSPGFDTPPNTQARSNLIRSVGAEIDAVSLRQLITNHFGGQTLTSGDPGTYPNDYRDFESESWLDLFLYQSGQAVTLRSDTDPDPQLQELTKRARTMPLDLRTFPARKASGNAESVYDLQYAQLQAGQSPPVWWPNYHQYRVRQTGYLSSLSGSFGYSIGVYGLFDWGLGYSVFQSRTPQTSVTGTNAKQSALQSGYLGNLFRSQRWEWFAPALLVRNNPPETNNQHLQMVASRDLTRRSTLAYMPNNGNIELQLSATLYPGFASASWTKKFFNPRSGAYSINVVTPTQINGTDVYRFDRSKVDACPDNGTTGNCDWVLELTDTNMGAAFAQSLDGKGMQVWTARDPATDTWNIAGQLVAADGSALSSEIQIGEPSRSLQRLPLVARGADGGFLVVWEAEDLDGDRSGVFARRLNGKGEPQDRPFQVNESSAGRQFEPVITADAIGQYVIAWTSYSLADQTVEIKFRRFSVSGKPLGPEMAANTKRPGVNRRSPLVSSDPVGNLAIGWQEYTSAPGEWSVVAREFDAAGTPRGGERDIARSRSDYLALERLEMDALGNFEVIWQRVLEAQSKGHYSRRSDRATQSLSNAAPVAGGNE